MKQPQYLEMLRIKCPYCPQYVKADGITIAEHTVLAQDFSEQMNSLFNHFAGAVNAVGQTSVEQLMLDYPAVSTFFQMLKITKQGEEMPW